MIWSKHLDVEDLLNAMQLGVVVHDADTTILDANPRALELLQITHDQAMGVDAFDPGWHFINTRGEPLELSDYPVNRVAASGAPLNNYRIGILHTQSPEPTWVSCNAYQRSNDFRIVVTFVDVTAEEQAKHSLALALDATRESETKLRDASFRLEVALSAIDAYTYGLKVESNTITFDRDLSPLLGYPSGELKSITLEKLAEISHPDDLKRRRYAVQSLLAGEIDTYESIARLRHRDGHWVWIENRSKALEKNKDGQVTRTVGLMIDISERKRMEDMLLQHQKMEALGTLAGGIAHDFNNLLAPMLGYAELVKRDLSAESKAFRQVQHITKAAERARELVQKILLVSRSSSTSKEPTSLNRLIEEVLVVIKASAPKGLVIESTVEEAAPCIEADAAEIYQVILNLCTNAVQAMSEGGTLSVRLSHSDSAPIGVPTSEGDAGYVMLEVQDTGSGIDKATQKQMFDPFFTTKTKGEKRGTGLGLSIVASVITEHKGFVDVTSELGQGSTFRLFFPAADKQELQTTEPEESTAKPQSAHLLLVDDEIMVRDLGEDMLQQLGYRVTSVADGEAALALIEKAPGYFDAVLTDYEMPSMLGPALIKALRDHQADLPIVLLTGYANLATGEQSAEMGADAVLAKPYDMTSLGDAVQQAISARSAH
jgi:PAS domain S-box-containing protein